MSLTIFMLFVWLYNMLSNLDLLCHIKSYQGWRLEHDLHGESYTILVSAFSRYLFVVSTLLLQRSCDTNKLRYTARRSMADAYVIEVHGKNVGIIVREHHSQDVFKFISALHAFNSLEGRVFSGPLQAEIAAKKLLREAPRASVQKGHRKLEPLVDL